jgi:hypothetical protein
MTATTVNLADYVIGDGPCTVYRFPNGHTASVHRHGRKFLVECEALDGDTMVPLNTSRASG